MSTLATLIDTSNSIATGRSRPSPTIEAEPNARSVLAWRPGPGRAHIGWQLMHIGITEELFASDRLAR